MQQILSFIRTELKELYTLSEIQTFTFQLMKFVCRMDKQAVLLDKGKKISTNECAEIERCVADLKKFRPIQYVTGETEFYGLPFNVYEGVLIPRPETEELVEVLINTLKEENRLNEKITILDVGTGSGCIAVSLKKNLPYAKVSALDVSSQALETARQNAKQNKVEIAFLHTDVLNDEIPGKWDVIVSNPPYITPLEKENMAANVLNFEPHEALFVPQDNPLLFYEKIADKGLTQLNADGLLFFEINPLFGREVSLQLKEKGYKNVSLLTDISGNERMIKARL